jgi:dGTPase
MPSELSEYDWDSPQETERAWTSAPHRDPGDDRTPFDRDRDRIIHSVAFRRLQGKTQIFAPSSADFVRSRVTHSIEVSQIGRALGRRFGVPESLVEAACLGHDLGHPPFGHTGEEVLNDLMERNGAFEGNAQTFRIVTRLEEKARAYPGLDLSRATLHALIKYPYRQRRKNPKFLYDDDLAVYEGWLFQGRGGGVLQKYDPATEPPRTLPCQLMDWADDIAYSVHDLEDGISSGMLQPSLWDRSWFMESIHRAVCQAPGIRWESVPPSEETVEGIIRELQGRLSYGEGGSIPFDVIRDATRHYINRFVISPTVMARGSGETLFDFKLDISEQLRIENQVLKSITFEYIIDDAHTRQLVYKGQEILRRLFEALCDNARSPGRDRLLLFPRGRRASLETLSDKELARATCDYLASMTEGQALQLYARMFEPSSAESFDLT